MYDGSKSSSQFITWFSRMFNRSRFQVIFQFFHIVDTTELSTSGQPGYDPCSRFKPLVDPMNRVSRFQFIPSKNFSINESMVSTKAHSQLLVIKCSTSIWMTTNLSNFERK